MLDRDAHYAAREERRRAARAALGRTRIAAMAARIDKAAFTRADMVELIGAQLPVDAPGDPRQLIEEIVDTVGCASAHPAKRITARGTRSSPSRRLSPKKNASCRWWMSAINQSRLDVRTADLDGLSADQQGAIRGIGVSPWLVQPPAAPAGAGKTQSLRALRTAAQRGGKHVLVLAPTGKAVDEAMSDGAGDHGFTVAKALHLLSRDELHLDRRAVVVVDEASMLATPDLTTLLAATTAARCKTVLVGDPYQLAPVNAPAAACSSSSATRCPGRSDSPRCGACVTVRNATPRSRCGPGAATGSAKPSAGTAPDRLHTGTRATIWASTVSEPTLVARTRSVPVVLIDAPITSEPGALVTGRLYPVTID
jgi:hypothetical protein